jgi:hypothetical protein
MPTRVKTPMERRICPFDLTLKISTGAEIDTVQVCVSRMTTIASTTLAGNVTIGDTSVLLNADPKAGALLIIDPSGSSEETVKVVSVTGVSAPFTANILPPAWANHSTSGAVNYEPGMNARMLVDDTPIPVSPENLHVYVEVQRGADGHSYRVSVIGTCDDGEVIEDEMTLSVSEVVGSNTRIKQPVETVDLRGNIAPLLTEPHQDGVTLSSAVAFASQQGAASTTLSSAAAAEIDTILLTAHPGIGALLTLNANQPNQEKVHVSGVSGGGPYSVVINPPLEFDHANAEPVSFEMGVSTNFLVSTVSTIQDLEVLNRARRGAAGKVFRVVWLATASNSERLQQSGLVSVQEVQ